MVDPILSKEKNDKIMAWYDAQIKLTNAPRPPAPVFKELPAGASKDEIKKNDDAFKAAYAAHAAKIAELNTNPMLRVVDDARKAVVDQGFDPNSPAGKRAFDEAMAQKRTAFEKGLHEGAKDQSHIQKAFQELVGGGGILAAIKEFFLSIPIIGDFMATGGKMIMSLFNGPAKGPLTAFDEIRKERALAGAFEAVGIRDPEQVKQFSAIAIKGAENVPPPTTGDGGSKKKDETVKEEPAKPVKAMQAGVALSSLKPDGTIADELQSIKGDGLRSKFSKDTFLVMVGDAQDIYVMTKKGGDLVIDGLFAKGKDGSYAAKTTSLKGTTVKTNTDNTLDAADLKKLDADSKLTRKNTGEILPESTAVTGSIDKPVPDMLTDALKSLGADKVIPAAMKKVADTNKTPEVVFVHDVTDDSYVAYVGSRNGNEFVVDQMFVTKAPDSKTPGALEMVSLKTGLTDSKFKLEGDSSISADTRKLLLADAKAPRNPADGTVVNLEADIAKAKAAIQQKSTTWFKDVLAMSDPSQFDAAKAGSIITSAKNAAEDSPAVKNLPAGPDRIQKAQKAELDNLKNGSDALSAIADAGVGLRKRFDELTKFDLGIKGDPNPDEKAALDKAWREFVDKNQTPNLKDLDQLDAGKLVKLSKELEEQLSNKQSIAAVREMGAKPGKVIDAAKLDLPAGSDDVPAQAITQFRLIPDLKDAKSNPGKKFIVVTEGGKTAVYIGKDETSGEGPDKKTAFKVEKSMQLQKDGKWLENKDASGTMLAYQEGKADEISQESIKTLKEKTEAMLIARTDTGMSPKGDLDGILDVFTNAIALAETRFPPSDKPAMKANTDELLVQRPDVPDLMGRGKYI